MFNTEKIKNECVEWIKNFFEENGRRQNDESTDARRYA